MRIGEQRVLEALTAAGEELSVDDLCYRLDRAPTTVYPTLRSATRMGLLSHRTEQTSTRGRPRHLYQVTPAGREKLLAGDGAESC